MVKHQDFKTCDQSGFCKRNRLYADTATSNSNWESPYTLDRSTIKFSQGILTGVVYKKIINSDESVRLPVTISFYESGVARVTIDEERRQQGKIELRHDRKDIQKQRCNEAEKWAIVGGTTVSTGAALDKDAEKGTTIVKYGPTSKFEAVIKHSPLSIDFKRDGETHIKLNDRGLLNVEHWRKKVEKKEPEKEGEDAEKKGDEAVVAESDKEAADDESTWWEESFGGNTDTKPKGPEAVALDVSFPGYEYVYGISEHTGPLALKETRGGDGQFSQPYRMHNSDVFEYEMDSPMTLYGSIPFMQAQKKDSAVGVFWLNGAETWVDITKTSSIANPLSLGIAGKTTTNTHWISESGLLDIFVFLGPTPQDVIGAYTELTGTQQLPQHFAIASHQCRWNYVTDEDVKDVDRKFDKARIPYDVIWLDIEYTDGKKYFTWDGMTFPDPIGMQKQLDEHERKLVVIIDPHIKNEGGYHVVDELKSKDLAVHNKEGSIYEGWCWPGSSHWVDCFNPAARKWFAGLFKYSKFPGTSKNVWLWNDMNEPSVFNGPEVTMPKDNVHHGGWEHRDIHNINGMTFVNATFEGLLARDKEEEKNNRRPFVLTRAFFSGSQRLGAMWTGDNQADWSHLEASIPMVLSMGITGFPFAGADIGGFFGNPSKELLTRWYQAGIWYPFMRAHAHIDTRRREPYLAGEPYTGIITQAVRLRYSLLPAWYTAFHESHVTGAPIVRPNYYMFPGDEKGFGIDDQFYLGSFGLLAKPVTKEGQQGQAVYLADKEKYYDYFDFWTYEGPGEVALSSPLETIPLLMRGGHIIPRRDRPRRSSGLMMYDPVTLVVVLGHSGDAEGTLYLDDGETYAYQDGAYIHRRFVYNGEASSLTSEDVSTSGKKTKEYLKEMDKVRVEKIIVVGAPDAWKDRTEVEVSEDIAAGKKSAAARKVPLDFHKKVEGKAAWAVVRDPAVKIGSGWKITF
ncbi:glycoside hydrolase family 31 protein [Pseudocercospora fijiensis CIRAD86]|uniref:alpha-glucosidase n=1 Tax=Pseudocercospora fijiensis (strain CIRAD86) TaxID=383855 RepID=M3AC82_PSEFD|nr:glycoside hydrolase family 31 protein [Pseudocercospora fijiensis CIRAD86]EME82171.1 glycoside hydrolase family 31 protein [Pseudocercospora fijiensis CIRAD86]